MFISRVQLNPRRRGAVPLLASPHALHAAVLASFPDPGARPEGRVLWRLDLDEHSTNLYIVSPAQPDVTHLVEQAGWPTLDDTALVRSYDPLLTRIEVGQRYAFRLTANPTHSAPRAGDSRGKVFGHVTVSQQEKWLLDRQERSGFVVTPADGVPSDLDSRALAVTARRTLSFSRRETRVTLSVATFEGRLEVTDRAAFVTALCHGIGRAKGYGCGLLTIAPAV